MLGYRYSVVWTTCC